MPINGTEGHDVLNGTAGDDVINGFGGNDQITGGEGNDILNGGNGTDQAIFNSLLTPGQIRTRSYILGSNFTEFETLSFRGGLNPIGLPGGSPDTPGAAISYHVTITDPSIALGAYVVIFASLGAQVVVALGADGKLGGSGANADTYVSENLYFDASALTGDRSIAITGGGGSDTLLGGSGNDTFTLSGGLDIVNGGGGFDSIDLSLSSPAVIVNLATGSITQSIPVFGSFNTTALGIERIFGSSAGDSITGGAANETLSGGGGDDIIFGGGGDDLIDGGTGVLQAFSGGVDYMDGGAGNDIIYIGANDTAIGGADTDTLYFDANGEPATPIILDLSAVWTGGVGTNGTGTISGFELLAGQIFSSGRDDQIILGTPNIVGGLGIVQIYARAGNDIVVGGGNIETILGGDGNDQLSGLAGNDSLYGENDNDVLNGGSGSDLIDGGIGSDRASYADNAGAVIIDLIGNYTLETALIAGIVDFTAAVVSTDALASIENATGSNFGDRIYADAAANILMGGGGDDVIYALDGDDFLQGDAGSDFLIGGNGNDTVNYTNATGAIFADLDYFVAESGLQTGTISAATLVLSTDYLVTVENLNGTNFGDRIYGNNGNNILNANGGNDIVYAGGGDDTIFSGSGSDILIGGAGIDLLDYSAAQGAIFADLLGAISETALQIGTVNAGIAVLSTDYAIEIENLNGSAFGDRLYGSQLQNTINGNAGNDIIYGGAGADILNGGDGDDRLIGEAGVDILIGGLGADRFILNSPIGLGEVDTIVDFNSGLDQIYISRVALGIAATAAWTYVTDGQAVSPNTLLFDSSTHFISFDADGAGPGAAVNVGYWSGGGFTPVMSDFVLY
jgi:Ca2+-binding RTX toxin-like protein